MSNSKDILNRFLKDAAQHTMTIHRDDGVYRHIEFSRPGTNCYRFDLVTWPGYLNVSGDMGNWTFSRIRDMFDFFQCDTLGINTGYWAEKLEAGSGCNRDLIAKDYDHAAFSESLKSSCSQWLESDDENEEETDWDDEDDTPDSDAACVREIVRELIRHDFMNDFEAYQAVYDADWPEGVSAWDICDGITFKTYTAHFKWILYAIVWGIGRYRAAPLVDKAMTTFLAVREAK